MTTSPYDNLPVTGMNAGNIQDTEAHTAPHSQAESDTPPASYHDESSSENIKGNSLQYIDVDIEEASPQEMEMPAAPEHEAPEALQSPQTPPKLPQASAVQNTKPQPVSPSNLKPQPQPKAQPKPPHRSRAKTTPMPKPPQYSALSIKNRARRSEYILPFEESLLVPDTMPDMSEILFAEANIHTAKPAGSKYEPNDFISGDMTFYTVYRPDSDVSCPVDVVKSSIPFKTDKCWGSSRDCTFRASASIRSVSAEKINERKFIARGELVFRVTEISQQELPVFKESSDPELICRHDSVKAADLTFEAEEVTDIAQEINIKDGDPEPVKILKESISIVENHKQLTSGKLVINAMIISNVLYLGEDAGEQKLCSFTNKTDFTQFIPVRGDLDINMTTIDFTGNDLKITITGSDEFQLQGQIRTLICGYSNTELPMVSDAYHKTRMLDFDIAQCPVTAVSGTVSGEISAREVINIDDSHSRPDRLISGTCIISEIKGRAENGRIIIDGSVPVTILAIDENNMPFVIKSSVPLRGSLEMPAAGDDFSIEVSAIIKEFWYDEINSRQIEVNINTAINVWICRSHTFASVTGLCFMDSDEVSATAPMSIYVTGSGDTLWDIAKRYRSDADAIAVKNNLDQSKPLSEGMKLLIMK